MDANYIITHNECERGVGFSIRYHHGKEFANGKMLSTHQGLLSGEAWIGVSGLLFHVLYPMTLHNVKVIAQLFIFFPFAVVRSWTCVGVCEMKLPMIT